MNILFKNNMCLFMSMIFILIQIKFDIDIYIMMNYWKPYENIRREEKKIDYHLASISIGTKISCGKPG
jgi:hypothetical protein